MCYLLLQHQLIKQSTKDAFVSSIISQILTAVKLWDALSQSGEIRQKGGDAYSYNIHPAL